MNPRPADYESAALPLSYASFLFFNLKFTKIKNKFSFDRVKNPLAFKENKFTSSMLLRSLYFDKNLGLVKLEV